MAIRIILNGICGKMGEAVQKLVATKSDEFVIVAGVGHSEKYTGSIPFYTSIFDVKEDADAVIDFSRPDAVKDILEYCKQKGIVAVIGTTGLTSHEREIIDEYAPYVRIFFTGNMSLGINLLIELAKKAASTLGENYEVEIIDKHHHLKVDSPSGTALMIADAISAEFPTPRQYVYGRYTRTEKRKPNEIGFHSIRGGSIVGEHEVMFIGPDEIVEINHRSYSKQVFALGALRAVKFMLDKQPGIYNMHDIVLEKDVLSHLYTTDSQAIVNVKGLSKVASGLSKVFTAIADKCVFVDMISVTNIDEVSFTIPEKNISAATNAMNELSNEYPDIKFDFIYDIAKLTVEGVGMEFRHGIASKLFEVLAKAGIVPQIVTTSETKIAYGIDSYVLPKAIQVIEDYLDL